VRASRSSPASALISVHKLAVYTTWPRVSTFSILTLKIAFDRAGTSNASAEDNQAFQGANTLKASGNDMWKKMVKDTKWFQTYCGGVKKFLSALAQDHSGGMLLVVCIHVSSTRQATHV
jgi:hypothetical protein